MKRDLDQFIQINSDDVLISSEIPADVFLKIGAENFVLVAHQGSKDQQQHNSLNEKVQVGAKLYVNKTDFRKFTQLHVDYSKRVFNDKHSTIGEKVTALSRVTHSVFSTISEIGFDQETFVNAQLISKSVIKTIDSHPNLKKLFEVAEMVSDKLVRHSLSVSIVSVMVAQNRGWLNPGVFEKVALGALLHDIGVKEFSNEFLNKPRIEYNAEDLDRYQKHCFRGVEILQSIPDIPIEVVAIVYEHHENAIGQGFPRALRDIHIHPYAKIVALAEAFCELTDVSVHNPKPKKPHETEKKPKT